MSTTENPWGISNNITMVIGYLWFWSSYL